MTAGVAAVEVRDLSKRYLLSGSQWARFLHLFAPGEPDPKDSLWALSGVSFAVGRGEALGIIGANGSGKSTLLQIVAGILRPTSGSFAVSGRLSALIELGSGFSPEFTGRDNVYLNGSLLGLSRGEIDARFADIERFAGIGEFIDQPIKTYSTGMVLRLAFAVAAHIEPEILIVDEALAVGDIAFRHRCMRRIHELRARGTTILFVSHETSDVKALCERCVWLEKGAVRESGAADDVVAKYLSATLLREKSLRGESRVPSGAVGLRTAFEGRRYGDGHATITGAELIDAAGRPVSLLRSRDRVVVRLVFRVNAAIVSPIAGFLVRNSRGENIFGSNTARERYPLMAMAPGHAQAIDFHWSAPELAPGDYRISVAVSDGDMERFHVCDYVEDAIEVRVAGGASTGYFQLHCARIAVHLHS